MNLRTHINNNFDGNRAAFARSINKPSDQVRKWEAKGCIWFDGNIWGNKTKLVPDSQNTISDNYSMSKEQGI